LRRRTQLLRPRCLSTAELLPTAGVSLPACASGTGVSFQLVSCRAPSDIAPGPSSRRSISIAGALVPRRQRRSTQASCASTPRSERPPSKPVLALIVGCQFSSCEVPVPERPAPEAEGLRSRPSGSAPPRDKVRLRSPASPGLARPRDFLGTSKSDGDRNGPLLGGRRRHAMQPLLGGAKRESLPAWLLINSLSRFAAAGVISSNMRIRRCCARMRPPAFGDGPPEL